MCHPCGGMVSNSLVTDHAFGTYGPVPYCAVHGPMGITIDMHMSFYLTPVCLATAHPDASGLQGTSHVISNTCAIILPPIMDTDSDFVDVLDSVSDDVDLVEEADGSDEQRLLGMLHAMEVEEELRDIDGIIDESQIT